MGKIPLCFPLVINGLIMKRTTKGQPDVMSIIFNGREVSEDKEPHLYIKPKESNESIMGKVPLTGYRVADFMQQNDEEIVRRIKLLEIQRPRTVVSAFHAFLQSEVNVAPEHMEALEHAIFVDHNPLEYIATIIRAAMLYRGISDVFADKSLIRHLRTLDQSTTFDDLFSPSLEASSRQSLSFPIEAAIPQLLKGVLSLIYGEDKEKPENAAELMPADFPTYLTTLLNKGKMSAIEYYRWANVLKISASANDELINNPVGVSSDTVSGYDFDWFMRFFEAAGNISKEDMQKLWAKVLAGEIRSPGAFSLRTIETLRNLTVSEAVAFRNASEITLFDENGVPFIYDTKSFDPFFNSGYNVSSDDLFLLQECGLLNDSSSHTVSLIRGNRLPGFSDGTRLSLVISRTEDNDETFTYDRFAFTQVGRELLSVVRELIEDDYIKELSLRLAETTKCAIVDM